jgi:hypothetical protein
MVLRMKTVYVLELISNNDNNISVESIGVYSTNELANEKRMEIIKRFPELFTGEKKSLYDLVIYSFVLDSEPELYNEKLKEETVNIIIQDLIDDELIDSFIGEDGEFYFGLTEKGLKHIEKKNKKDKK